MKRRMFSLLMMAAAVFGCVQVRADALTVADVKVYTTVRKTGQYPDRFVVMPGNGWDREALESLSETDFRLDGKASKWGDDSLHDFSCGFESVTIDENGLTLVPDQFPEKYFYVKEWTITCKTNDGLTVSSSQVSDTFTDVADSFETVEDEEHHFSYHLYTPEGEGALPVVVVFHGYGDTHNLLTYRTAVEWAEPENQQVHPCYVIAPVIEDQAYILATGRDLIFAGVKEKIDALIAEGKVDPNRIYVMGNSFGGMSSIEFAEKYPEETAAVLALCPAVGYSAGAIRNLEKITDVPIWFAHAVHDQTIPEADSEKCLKLLTDAGSTVAQLRAYTDEEMNAAGADPSPDSTYSYHHVELAVMEDDTYMEWLFSH